MNQADVVIHIAEELDSDRIHDMEHALSLHEGVISACMHERRRHLLVVDYEPLRVRSSDLLSRVRADGLHAVLIGF
ncbi:MAG: ATP-binding protein [Thioalkalivibrio sp.]|nr:ATP-binding protein [Thioalkalivibrio sp.]